MAAPSWAGCGAFGTVSYVFVGNTPTSSGLLAIIDGTACYVSGNQNAVTAAAAIMAQATAGAAAGVKGYLTRDPASGHIEAAVQ